MAATKRSSSPWYSDFRLFLVLLAIFTIFLLMSIFGRDHGAGPGGGIGAFATGKPAPDIDLTALTGEKSKLSALHGKVVFLNFWATWCAPCKMEVPAIQSVYKKFLNNSNFAVVAISCDQTGAETVRKFVEQEGVTFPVYLDPEMKSAAQYGVTGFPETYLIGRDGKIREKFVGPRDWDDQHFRSLVTELLGENP